MGRSKESAKRKRTPGSRDSGYYAKRSNTASVAHRVATNFPKEENATQSSASSSAHLSFCDVTTTAQIPYHSWSIYFYNQVYNEKSTTLAKIDAFMEFFERNASQTWNFETEFNLDVHQCTTDPALTQRWPSILEDMNANPQHTFNCIRAAFFETTMRQLSAYKILPFMKIFRILRLCRINIMNHETLNALPHLKLSSFGKLVSISGVVINVGAPKPGVAFVVLVCKCKREIIAKQEHGAARAFVPRKCNVCGDGQFKRSLDSIHQFTKLEQNIQIKDYFPTDQMMADDGNSPNIISVKLDGSLVDNFVPGDKIRVIGISRITLGVAKSTTPGSCPLYIDAISAFGDDKIDGNASRNYANIPINWDLIESIKSQPDVLGLLTKSLCPRVQGHETIKAALVLGLFAGSSEYGETRDYVHTLIIGDLGLEKSQLLRACAQIAPKGVYARGSSMKSLGPTVMNVRDAGVEDSRLESGVFPLASDGLYCIDELDKVSAQHQSMHECMEDRRVNVTNPEIKLDLEARAAMIGIINPIKKRYEPSKTILENVNASPELLSRFDMIFLMRDHPDTYRDRLMCDRMFDVYTRSTQNSEQTEFSGSEYSARISRCRSKHLDTPDESGSDILPQQFFQMYIRCARMYVKPEMMSASRACITTFCSLRYQTHRESVANETLVRIMIILSQACAKISLRAEVTEEDVEMTVEILKQTRSLQMTDRSVDRLVPSSSNSNKLTTNKVNQFITDLRSEAELLKKTTFTTDQLYVVAGKENFTEHAFSSLLSKLNEQGYLLKITSNLYKLVSN